MLNISLEGLPLCCPPNPIWYQRWQARLRLWKSHTGTALTWQTALNFDQGRMRWAHRKDEDVVHHVWRQCLAAADDTASDALVHNLVRIADCEAPHGSDTVLADGEEQRRKLVGVRCRVAVAHDDVPNRARLVEARLDVKRRPADVCNLGEKARSSGRTSIIWLASLLSRLATRTASALVCSPLLTAARPRPSDPPTKTI